MASVQARKRLALGRGNIAILKAAPWQNCERQQQTVNTSGPSGFGSEGGRIRSHLLVERDEHCADPLRDRDMQRIRRPQGQIETPQECFGRNDVCRADI